jgi:hypothetical protein
VLSSSGQSCTPVAPVISNIFYGTAAAVNWQLLSQNIGADGYFDMLSLIAGNWREPPYSFSNSANGPEDALGLIAALVVSRVNTSGSCVPADRVAVRGTAGSAYATVLATRLRPGNKVVLLLLFAPICSVLILGYLILRSFSIDLFHLREAKASDVEFESTFLRYVESMRELILLGRQLREIVAQLETMNGVTTHRRAISPT